MQVHYDEGVANHIDPEPCAGIREDVGEASAGERAGQPLSRESLLVPGADAVSSAEGDTNRRTIASAWSARRGRRTWHACTLPVREPGGLTVDQRRLTVGVALARVGKARSRSRRCTTMRSLTSP